MEEKTGTQKNLEVVKAMRNMLAFKEAVLRLTESEIRQLKDEIDKFKDALTNLEETGLKEPTGDSVQEAVEKYKKENPNVKIVGV